jgi:hypothetical protein
LNHNVAAFLDSFQICVFVLTNSRFVTFCLVCLKLSCIFCQVIAKVSFGMRTRWVRTFDNSAWDHGPGGTTTQARLTLLDAWSDAYETSHGCSSHLGEVLAARSSVPQPFLSRSWAENGGILGFRATERPFLALHDLKPVLATCKPTENGFNAPCCGSSPIVVVVRQ